MAGKRKDKSGRVLKTGENQRKNGTYDYRYTDGHGKVRCVYAKTLEALREKESAIQRDLADGIDYAAGEITASELVDRYMGLKRDIGPNTLRAYQTAVNRIRESDFGKLKVRNVKLSDAKRFYIELHDKGIKRNTITGYHSILRPAFEMAVDDDMIRKNPFKFKVADILPDDAAKRTALTKSQQETYLKFIRENGQDNYYDDIVILLGTGLRVSELYGLTKKDIDFKKRHIFIEHRHFSLYPYIIVDKSSKFRRAACTKTCLDLLKTLNFCNTGVQPLCQAYSTNAKIKARNRVNQSRHLQFCRCRLFLLFC